ncbi:MAG: pyridoxine 5'-phosphate synthase [candidate division Zixibacteria bacterium]
MIRLSVDLEPLYRLYNIDGTQAHKPLLKHALALEAAGVDGVVFGVEGAYDSGRRRVMTALSENLDINLSVRTSIEEQWIDALLEIKPSLAIFAFDGNYEDSYKDVITRLQVENILVAFEIKPQIELVKKAARLKGDFLVFDSDLYVDAKSLGERIEQLNLISKAAALGSRLSMGSVAAGDFDKQRLVKLAETKTVEEIFSGLPLITDSLLSGYAEAVKSLRSYL